MLLLLLLSPHGERTRRWVQDKLWSTRGSEQGAASLRQSLRQIKAAFAEHGDCLTADRQRIALDPGAVELVWDGQGDVAEGLDVRDPEFEDWLTVERRAAGRPVEAIARAAGDGGEAHSASNPARRVVVSAAKSDDSSVQWLGQLVADAIVRNLRERLTSDIVCDGPSSGEAVIVVSVSGYRESDTRVGLRIAIGEGAVANQIWSGYRMVNQSGAPPVEDPVVQQVIEEGCNALETLIRLKSGPGGSLSQDDPDALCQSAIRNIFSMRPEQLLVADDLLRKAHAIRPHSMYLAWRAQIRVIQYVERHAGDPQQFKAEGEQLVRQALEVDAGTSVVHAISSNVQHFLLRDHASSLEYALRSVQLNPASPMALWSRSTARLYTGDAKSAHRDAVHGRFLAKSSEFRFFWDLQQSATSMVLGKLDDASRLLERASVQCPTFRPPHRYLTALHAERGETSRALSSAAYLRSLEPDFSIDRLLNDPSYPASLIKKSPALSREALSALL
ncbi:hypothetical protein [Gymnodinialimonas ceratoperidinii]|uniref:Uncharacterized protein n=1 Tax=Gymnodinialimonas ceratoperidinii TaxID=2856823 RepID=A0A8F6YC92_9RHOB|nr:hypothetical protein [Gymnodinialimonas ceratoperidinii]QXT39055.1 hypothetical protein KYE46_14115 [Gymnodinialimonas ceratoperidinii]